MAAEVEVQAGEVGRSVAGGRLHLSPLTDSSNKNLLEISTMNQSHIISPEPSKPVPSPKPRLTPKPFAVEKNPTIKPILAPKPQPKTRSESTRPAGYKPELTISPKPPQLEPTSKPRPVSTIPSRLESTSFKTSKLNAGQTTKPVSQLLKPAPPLLGDPSKPVPAERQKPVASNLTYSKSLKRPPSAEWSGSTKKEEKDLVYPSKVGPSITRAKSMGYLLQTGQEEEKPKPEAGVPLRPQPRGIRTRPVSEIFPSPPTKTESPHPVFPRTERRPLSADLTSKFESIGLSLHRKTPKANVKENTPEDKVPPQKREQEKSLKSTTTQSTDAATNPAVSDQTKDNISAKENEDLQGVSIKSRISLFLDTSSSPVTPAPGHGPDIQSPVQTGPEAEPAVGVKQLIKQLTEDTTPNQSPVLKSALKTRPLPLDLTKRFSPDPDVSLSEATDRHDSSKAPQKRNEDSVITPSDLKTFVDLKESQDQMKTPVSEASDPWFSPKDSEVQTVRAALFENVVEKHSVLMVDENNSENIGPSSPLLQKTDEGKLVNATYKEPVSPSGPVRVVHAFDTVQAVEESRAVSESVRSAHWEDKAMTLRSRRSEGTKTSTEKTVLEPASTALPEQQPRYLRVGALPKWTTDLSQEACSEKGMPKDSQREDGNKPRESEYEDASAAAKRLKTQQTDDQAKPRATYFALTGQMQETVADIPLGDSSMQWSTQGKILPFRRNPSLDEAFAKTAQSQTEKIGSRDVKTAQDGQGAEEMERKIQKELEREKQRQLQSERQANLEFAQMKEWEIQRDYERQQQKAFEEKQALERHKQTELEKQQHIELERQKQVEFENQKQFELKRQQQELERLRQIEIERQKQTELERQRHLELKRQKQQELDRQKQIEIERQKQFELEKQRKIELERQKQLELERQKQIELERQRQIEIERQRQIEIERQRQIEIERQRQIEIERQRKIEIERQKQIELEKQRQVQLEKERQIELERQKIQELERAKQMELEKERQRQLEKERQRELERREQEKQKERQRMQAEEQERKQLEFQKQKQKEKERQQVMELEKQRLREKMEREQADKLKQMALEQEMLRLRELDKERERQRELEREHRIEMEKEKQRELKQQRQRELERERQNQLDSERQELDKQKLRHQEEKERLKKKELEILKEMERKQLLEFEKQKQAERQQILNLEKHRLREKIEREEAEKMRQIAKQQEAERQRLKEKQKKEDQERIRLEAAALRPKVVDLDAVLRNDQLSKTVSPRSDPSTRWKEPSPRAEQTFRPGILDLDSFTFQSQPSPSRDLFPVSGIQEVGERIQMPQHNSGGLHNPVWTLSSQDPWDLRSVEMSVDKPEQTQKQLSKASPEQLLFRQEERLQAPQRRWSGLVEDPFQMGPFSEPDTKNAGSPAGVSSSFPTDQIWLPREPQVQRTRGEGPSQRRSQGSQELTRMRSRSMSRRSTPSSSAVEGSLFRMRSRSAHRDQALESWVQQKQSVSTEDESKDSETPVHETDSQYGTWETGLRSEDSLTPATPSSESNLSPSPKKPTSPQTPVDHTPHLDSDTPDGIPPSSSSDSQPLSFPDSSVTLLDTSAHRSRAQLGKKRAPRTRPTRAARQSGAQAEEGSADDWFYKDSTEEKVESKTDDSDSEQAKGADAGHAAAAQPQRVSLFPGMDPSALMAQLKKRGESDNQTDGPNPASSQLSRSTKSPFLPRAARVLPPPGGKENGEEDSPQWLKELKSKKRLSQYDNDS